jgi:pimeloyl-ACP methyl ester carboxylesterase
VPVTTRLAIHGRELDVQWWGSPSSEASPLVLLHEGLGSVGRWRDLPATLAERTGHPVFAYSRFGHGASDPPATPHTTRFMHDEADLLPDILDAAGIGRAILLGHSDGGSISILAAARSPERVAGLILEAPHVFVEDVGLASIAHMRTRYRESDLRERLAKHHRHVDVVFGGWCDVWLDPDFRGWNLEDELPRVHCPTLVIQGELDRYGTLAQVDAIAAGIAGPVERLVLPDCGHTPHRDQRDTVLDAIERFVAGLT